jgi:Kef-type K+ transport system membrane component KefB
MAVEQAAFLHIVLSLGILLFAAKLLAELFQRIKMPVVLGELLAGIIVGPFALGALPFFDGKPLVVNHALLLNRLNYPLPTESLNCIANYSGIVSTFVYLP